MLSKLKIKKESLAGIFLYAICLMSILVYIASNFK